MSVPHDPEETGGLGEEVPPAVDCVHRHQEGVAGSEYGSLLVEDELDYAGADQDQLGPLVD